MSGSRTRPFLAQLVAVLIVLAIGLLARRAAISISMKQTSTTTPFVDVDSLW
jgi:hypothetical protein